MEQKFRILLDYYLWFFPIEECYECTVSYFYRPGIYRRFCSDPLSDEQPQVRLNFSQSS